MFQVPDSSWASAQRWLITMSATGLQSVCGQGVCHTSSVVASAGWARKRAEQPDGGTAYVSQRQAHAQSRSDGKSRKQAGGRSCRCRRT